MLEGWHIIARKVNEIVLAEDCCIQVMYYFLCPPDTIPSTAEELEQLGYVPLRKLQDGSYYYLGKVWVNSKSDEKKTFFKLIGSFPQVFPPANETIHIEGKHFREDQYPAEIDGAYFWYLENDVGYGYSTYGIMPCCARSTGCCKTTQ